MLSVSAHRGAHKPAIHRWQIVRRPIVVVSATGRPRDPAAQRSHERFRPVVRIRIFPSNGKFWGTSGRGAHTAFGLILLMAKSPPRHFVGELMRFFALTIAATMLVPATPAIAQLQSTSIGGTIGKRDKSASGTSQATTHRPKREPASRQSAAVEKLSRFGVYWRERAEDRQPG